MAKLAFRSGALKDLAEIASYIQGKSGQESAVRFTGRIVTKCEAIARLPTRIGRRRPELGKGYRSLPLGRYVIVFRYADEDEPRSHVYVVAVIHASRDLASFKFDDC